jgi:hypothetical protein
VPVAGSAAQRAVETRVRDLSTRFRAFGVDSLAATSVPAGASARLGVGGLQTLLTNEGFGIAGDTLRGLVQSGTGDVEVAASVQWLDTFRGDERARLAPRGLHLRSTVTAGYRLGVGSGDLPFYWFDVPTGSGVSALLLRSATDVVLGRRAWATAVVRVAQPIADQPIVRVPAAPGELFVPAGRELTVRRQLGRELELELTPRYSFGDVLGVWAQYRLRSKAADEYEGRIVVPPVGGAPGRGGRRGGAQRRQRGPRAAGRARPELLDARGARRWAQHAAARGELGLPDDARRVGRGAAHRGAAGPGAGLLPRARRAHARRHRRALTFRRAGAAGSGAAPAGRAGRPELGAGRGAQQLARVGATHLTLRVAAQQTRDLVHALVGDQHPHVGGRHAGARALGDLDVVVRARRDLRQVRDGEHLVVLGDAPHRLADHQPDAPRRSRRPPRRTRASARRRAARGSS